MPDMPLPRDSRGMPAYLGSEIIKFSNEFRR